MILITYSRNCTSKKTSVLNDATTGRHTLQGVSKDGRIIPVFPNNRLQKMLKNWEYVVLSRVRNICGSYILNNIDTKDFFKPSKELTHFLMQTMQNDNTLVKAGSVIADNHPKQVIFPRICK